MLHEATHNNFASWNTATVQLDTPVTMTEKAVMLSGEVVKGSVWFPLSCVNVVDQFEVEIPTWLLSKKGLNFLS